MSFISNIGRALSGVAKTVSPLIQAASPFVPSLAPFAAGLTAIQGISESGKAQRQANRASSAQEKAYADSIAGADQLQGITNQFSPDIYKAYLKNALDFSAGDYFKNMYLPELEALGAQGERQMDYLSQDFADRGISSSSGLANSLAMARSGIATGANSAGRALLMQADQERQRRLGDAANLIGGVQQRADSLRLNAASGMGGVGQLAQSQSAAYGGQIGDLVGKLLTLGKKPTDVSRGDNRLATNQAPAPIPSINPRVSGPTVTPGQRNVAGGMIPEPQASILPHSSKRKPASSLSGSVWSN